MATGFYGPLFIVGMPRSGTKLIRALLNQHPRINLTLAESHFIPHFVYKFGNPPPFRVRADLHCLVRELQQTAFFSTMRKAGYSLDDAKFLESVDCTKWSAIFEHVFRHFGAKKSTEGTIWGDKTPGYINHIPLLKALFPEAKFLHVIRDPRDYCLSVRKSFAKSIYRAAHRWRQCVEAARKYGAELHGDYAELRYELFIEHPVANMQNVAAFLGVSYDDRLVDLASAPEDLGDARGQNRILADNKAKYRTQISSGELKRIEEIVCDVAKSAGYRLENDVLNRLLNPLMLGIFKLYDAGASLRHHVALEGNFANGTARLFRHYTRSSWRLAKF
jgi:hypothetical protein